MLKKIKNIFNNNECGQILSDAHINSEQQLIDYSQLRQLKAYLITSQKRSKLFTQIVRGFKSKKWVEKLKFLILIHYLLSQTLNSPYLIQFISSLTIQQITHQQSKFQQLTAWIHTQIVDYYHHYIFKLNMQIQLYNICKNTKEVSLAELSTDIVIITQSFKVLNLINHILQTQLNINKLGRYYPKFIIIIQLFKMYLQDIKVFYQYLRIITSLIYDNYQQLPQQSLKHCFLFVLQMQRINDKLYQFFYNRYFYHNVKQIIFPTFFKMDDKKHQKMVRYVRKKDKSIQIPFTTSHSKKKSLNQTQLNLTKIDYQNQRINQNNRTMIYSLQRSEIIEDRLNEKFPDLENYMQSAV